MAAPTIAPKIRKQPVDPIERLRAELLALPLPPKPTRGRTYPTHTILGRVMRIKRLRVNDVIAYPGAPSYRTMADILAGRRTLLPDERHAIAAGMGIDSRLLE